MLSQLFICSDQNCESKFIRLNNMKILFAGLLSFCHRNIQVIREFELVLSSLTPKFRADNILFICVPCCGHKLISVIKKLLNSFDAREKLHTTNGKTRRM